MGLGFGDAQMSFIERIRRSRADAVIERCRDVGCELRLHGLNDYVILKGEKVCTDRKICDCIIFVFHSGAIAGVVELKSTTKHANEIVEKLINGSQVVSDIVATCGSRIDSVSVRFLVLYRRNIHTSEYVVLKSRKIMIQGRRYDILIKTCGTSFSEVL